MKDLSNPFWIKLKVALLLLLAIWCFCRAYYFAFYVIEHHVDPNFKFSGLGAFVACLVRPQKQKP